MMEFRMLGALEAHADGHRIDLGPFKQRALLALLLIHVDRVVPTDRILEELWGDDAAGKEKALWVHISRLRSALEPLRADRGGSSVLITRDHGYLIRVDAASVDARRFEAAVAEARALMAVEPEAASEILREALALWRGGALQDFAYDDFARAEIARLEELRVQALETRIEADLQRGLSGELVGELEELVQQQPLRERPVVQLMHALYRAGRQAEALRAFQRFRRRIGDELGIEPSPELCRLEEQILVHDTRLAPASVAGAERAKVIVNPFKGLHAFRETDAEDFFGRDRLVAEVVSRINGGGRLVALVGPSGSGKSSVVRAGVVPALRKGALAGSEGWLFASMVPGAHPFAELEAALLRSTIDAPDSFSDQLEDPTLGLLRGVLRVLPDDTSRLVLVIDQFEELFTLVEDESERRRFLANLVAALDEPYARVVVIVTLRADSYHRPLGYAELAARLASSVVNVLPLSSDELESAAQEPAARSGVSLEPALLAELLADVIGEPGALPIFQYALTELFDRRHGDVLTAAAYRAMGGVRGVLSRRADDLYHRLTLDEQEAARQLFLRLVTITEHDDWGRRRVPASEIISLDVDVVTMESVIDQLGRHRFLAFDRDQSSAAPTVEVAHEALLWEWDRLRGWIEDGRHDVNRRAALDAAIVEWEHAECDADYLLAGNRLAEYERWRASTSMSLTTAEQAYLDASLTRRDEVAATESARTAREAQLGRRARRRWWGLVAGAAALAVVALVVFVLGPDTPPSVALVYAGRGDGDAESLVDDGLDRAVEDFGVAAKEVTPPFTDIDASLDRVAGADLVIARQEVAGASTAPIAARHPQLKWAYVDIVVPGAPSVVFAEQEGAFLVGAAAALASQTGTIGFVGGFQFLALERTRAGFEAGARAVNPAIKILASYLDVTPSGFGRDDLARAAATDMYQRGADVVLHVAGTAGYGVFAAARAESDALGRHLWAIGMDSDQYLDVEPLERPYVLTSMIKKFDVAVYELVHMLVDGRLRPGALELGLAEKAVGYSTTGGHLSIDTITRLERYRQEIIAGTRVVPRAPTGVLEAPIGSEPTTTLTVTFDGSACRYKLSGELAPAIVRVEFVNNSDLDGWIEIAELGELSVQVPAVAHTSNSGYAALEAAGSYTFECRSGSETTITGPSVEVG